MQWGGEFTLSINYLSFKALFRIYCFLIFVYMFLLKATGLLLFLKTFIILPDEENQSFANLKLPFGDIDFKIIVKNSQGTFVPVLLFCHRGSERERPGLGRKPWLKYHKDLYPGIS